MRSNYYVAMSRVTKKQNLYFYGADCLIGDKKVGKGYGIGENRYIRNLTSNEAKKAREYYLNNSVVQVEMARMRQEKKVQLDFENIFAKKSESNISILF
jgi:predicted PolB exonuclease-like 3'-5' exonuclease